MWQIKEDADFQTVSSIKEQSIPVKYSFKEQVEQQIKQPEFRELILRYFPNGEHFEGNLGRWSTRGNYRNEGQNYLEIDHDIKLTFHSKNFGQCCGAQVFYQFWIARDSHEFASEFFRILTSKLLIPHFSIFVKTIGADGHWKFIESLYDTLAPHGKLIMEWRNPLYRNHLLSMYAFYNREKFDSFLFNLTPLNIIQPDDH